MPKFDAELKTYQEWKSVLEKENNCKVAVDKGYHWITMQNKENELLTKDEARGYFLTCIFVERN